MQIPEQNFIEGAWSSYGEEFAFSFGNILGNVKDRYGQIYVVNADGSDLHLVTPRFESTSPRRPFWSPDGQKLAFWIWEPEHSPYPTIGVVTLATGEVNLLARGVPKGPSLVESTDLVWSPDSQWIAFTILSDQADIGALNVQSGEIYCITQDKNISEKVMDWR